VGLFAQEVVLYVSVAAVGTFLTPSVELANANRLVRLAILVLTALFGLPGFLIGSVGIIVSLALTRSFGVPYLWPLFPLNLKALLGVAVRRPVATQNMRPSILRPIDRDRQVVAAPARKPGKK